MIRKDPEMRLTETGFRQESAETTQAAAYRDNVLDILHRYRRGAIKSADDAADLIAAELARLRAQNAEMLAALKRLSAGMNDQWDSNPAVKAEEVRQARAAIARAEGRQP